MKTQTILLASALFTPLAHAGEPFGDAVHAAGPQKIPGPVFCAYYDKGGEGVAYHDNDALLSFTVDANSIAVPCNITSTFDAADTIDWRQWHHWNVALDAVTLKLPKGLSVIKIMNVEGGNINLATLVFRPSGSDRKGPAITNFKTALPKVAIPATKSE